jgi:hypothetical protein
MAQINSAGEAAPPGKLSKGMMDLCGDTTTNQELPRSPNQELTPAEEEGG